MNYELEQRLVNAKEIEATSLSSIAQQLFVANKLKAHELGIKIMRENDL
jgi:hypothetical protein